MSVERHRHYFRSGWGWTCRCGEYEPYTEEWEAVQQRRAIEAEERERITEAVQTEMARWQPESRVYGERILAIVNRGGKS